MIDPPVISFCVTKLKRENKGEKRKSFKAEAIKRLSPRSKCQNVADLVMFIVSF